MGFSIRIGHFHSAMRFRFKHASAVRDETHNIIVAMQDDEGRIGYGEGCPRHYVTGETSAGALSFLKTYGADAAHAATQLHTFKDWCAANVKLIDENPAAFCALELAALDLLGKRENRTIESMLGLPAPRTPVSYTAVIGDSSPGKMLAITLAYRFYGFASFKVKLGGDLEREKKRLAPFPDSAIVRFDANNLWNDAESCIAYCKQLKRNYWAIEEPVHAFDADALIEIAQALDTRIILDESCLLESHLAPYLTHPELFIANIRVSKCGGILRSIQLANHCLTHGIDVILGAHVGETSLLTRAALVVSQGMAVQPIAREGAYGQLLLKQDVTENSIRFHRGGILHPNRYHMDQKSGHGIDVQSERIDWE